jgi:predicted GNAT family N-acyltransferase
MSTYIEIADWATLQTPAAHVRTQVFVHEQGVPAHEEWDVDDSTAIHAVLFHTNGQALGTSRLLQPQPNVAKVGRMAVLREWRGQGCGQRLLQAMMAIARDRGDREVVLSAQRSAEGLYAKHGFVSVGLPYDEVGIEHVAMRLVLMDDPMQK